MKGLYKVQRQENIEGIKNRTYNRIRTSCLLHTSTWKTKQPRPIHKAEEETLSVAITPHALKLAKTRNSAIAEGPRDALRQLKACQLLHNCTKNSI